jgi:hypothetical protein
MHNPLSINGLVMPPDFPVVEHEAIHQKVAARAGASKEACEQFVGAWKAQANRFLALTEYEAAFCASLANFGTSPGYSERYRQERDLFGYFCNGVSVFEATFYGLFSVGALLSPMNFPIATAKDLKKISPRSTADAFNSAFPSDPIIGSIHAVLGDPAYLELHRVRNILTHRVVPARTFRVSVGVRNTLPDQWNIEGIPLDANMLPSRRADLSRLLNTLLSGIDRFAKIRL